MVAFSGTGSQGCGRLIRSWTKNGASQKIPVPLSWRYGYKVANLFDAATNYLIEPYQFFISVLAAVAVVPVFLEVPAPYPEC